MSRPPACRDVPARLVAGPGLILSVCLTLGLLGPHEEVVATVGTAIGLGLWAAGGGCSRSRSALAVMIGLPLVCLLPTSEARLAAITVIALMGRSAPSPDGMFAASVLAWQVVHRWAPIVWRTEVELSRGLSALIGTLTGQSLDLGPSASGLDLLIVLLLYSATHGGFRGGRAAPRILSSLLALLTYIAVLPLSGEAALAWGLPLAGSLAGSMFGWKSFLLVVLCLVLVRSTGPRERRRISPRVTVACLMISILLIPALADPENSAARRRPGRIVFLRSPVTDTNVPEHGRHGISRAGMFGLLPPYLSLDGHLTTLHEGPLTRRVIDSAAVLVVALPVRAFDEEESAAIRSFVERGGSLLVMGDHTDLLGIMRPLNELTGQWGIHFRFDSAYPAVRRWSRCLAALPRGRRTGIGTGASLQISPPARPALVARYALSDAGDRANGGAGAYLGNYTYDAGERLGDLVVAAAARHGAGRVLVLGDTSPFQNVQLPTSYGFVATLVSELASRPDSSPWKGRMAALLAAVLGALVLGGIRAAAAGLACSVLAGTVLTISMSEAPPIERLSAGTPVALIDSAHLNGFSRRLWRSDSVGGLIVNLQRAGYLPLMIEGEFPPGSTGRSSLPVLIEPRKRLARSELRRLRGHLERGGEMLVAAGGPGGDLLGPLLAPYGIDIGSLPLGPHPIRLDMNAEELARARRSPQFRRAHPVLSAGPLRARSHYRAFGRDVVLEVETSAGGRLMVIADPDFLTDRVLENEHSAWEGNVALLSRLLAGSRG